MALALGSVKQSIVEKLVKYNLGLLSIKVIEMGLCDGLNDPKKKDMVVADCVRLMDEVVASTEGLTGLGLKASYAGVKGIRPGYAPAAIEGLLPASLAALDPIWSEGIQTGNPAEYLIQNSSRTADALLSVTDAKIEKARSSLVRNAYKKFRNSSKPYVEKAVPGLAQIIDNYTKG